MTCCCQLKEQLTITSDSSPVNPCLHVLTAGGLKMKCEKPVSTLKNNINFSFQLLSRLSWTYGQNTEKLSLIIHYDHPV